IIDRDGAAIEPYDDGLHLMQESARERYLALLARIGLSHQHQGLMRAAAVRRTALHGDHVASDMDFLAELSLHGKFCELPERLFFRRMHPDALSWRKEDTEDIRQRTERFYDPDRSHGIVMHHWRRHAAHVSAVLRAPIPLHEKMALVAHEAHAAVSERDLLLREIGLRMRNGRASRSPTGA